MGIEPLPEPLQAHFKTVIKGIVDGRIVPFLGAGVNLCGRPRGVSWDPQLSDFLPSGSELSVYLAKNFGLPGNDTTDLVRISQFVALMNGAGPLYEELHGLFDRDYPATALHRFLASIPELLTHLSPGPKYQLIVTTNYDDVLERAFRQAGAPFDVVTYIAAGEQCGRFRHTSAEGWSKVIEIPNEYRDVPTERRTVILKMHGAVDRQEPPRDGDSYVITEDHYIEYLTRTDLSNLLPVTLAAKLRRSGFLFLGYGLRDWNLRVILHRIAREQPLNYQSWAVQLNPSELERKFWGKRDVEILDMRLERYIAALRGRMRLMTRAVRTTNAGH